MKKSLLLTVLFLSGCSAYNNPRVAPELRAIYWDFLNDAFYYDAELDLRNLEIELKNVYSENEEWDGYCETTTTMKFHGLIFVPVQLKKIAIEKSLLNDPARLRVVLYHELGHCALGYKRHANKSIKIDNEKVCLSLMNDVCTDGDHILLQNWDLYVEALFSKKYVNSNQLDLTPIDAFL